MSDFGFFKAASNPATDSANYVCQGCESLRAEVERLREQMNTRYWDGIREENTRLRARIAELEAK